MKRDTGCPSPHQHQSLIDSGVVTLLPDGRLRLTPSAWRTMSQQPTLHFVGFKDDRWHNAVKTFGKPDFIHRRWDYRAFCEVAPGDVVVFADGGEHQEIYAYAFDDSANF